MRLDRGSPTTPRGFPRAFQLAHVRPSTAQPMAACLPRCCSRSRACRRASPALFTLLDSRRSAMAAPLASLASSARPSSASVSLILLRSPLVSPSPRFSNTHPIAPLLQCRHPNSSLAAGAALRRPSQLDTGKRSESGHGLWANQLTNAHCLKATFDSERNSSASANDDENDLPPPGCSRIKVQLGKPLGIAFEEDKFGNVFVDEVIEGGNAYKSGLIDAGDQLIATSAIIYGSEEDYQGVMVRKGMQIIRLNVRGERFETVMAAIGTHPAYIKVEMEFQKCKPVPKDSLNGSTRN